MRAILSLRACARYPAFRNYTSGRLHEITPIPSGKILHIKNTHCQQQKLCSWKTHRLNTLVWYLYMKKVQNEFLPLIPSKKYRILSCMWSCAISNLTESRQFSVLNLRLHSKILIFFLKLTMSTFFYFFLLLWLIQKKV